ncbi:NAD(P)H-binding protein [Streptomyces sp. NBC_00083]|uniref:NAD(P)H-binding protein n=1 Tax=Streptomyces sp. NBC_00083 TaxID=2975647 RepID=UPI00224FAB86|nr:NAD(P)H-binding protein [Streptomyces sp. NBC_00083]MCX5384339.1 NAD(P)H-binding protein [Streptomyces sp. NBC_00083]
MILVTGATGTVGRLVLDRLPADQAVRALTRDPSRISTTRPRTEIVRGDYADQPSLERALTGVRGALLVTSRVGGDDDARFLAAARATGVQHIVKLSAAAVQDPGATDLVTSWQRANEDLLRASGIAWTLLRPRAFMSNTLSWASGIRSEGVVRALYGSAGNACVDPRDIADAAVRALTGSGHHGQAYTLTGPEALTAVQQTGLLARALDVDLRFEELSPDDALTAWSRRYPEALAQALLHSAERQQAGAKRAVDPALPALTGRPARSYATWAADHAAAFSAPVREGKGREPEPTRTTTTGTG